LVVRGLSSSLSTGCPAPDSDSVRVSDELQLQ
jgi:hypothetical protein